jgi:hypothetical protein
MQLINTSVYEKNSQARAKAIEESRQKKLQHRQVRQRQKLKQYLQKTSPQIVYTKGHVRSPSQHEYTVMIGDTPYRVVSGGKKLQRVDGETRIFWPGGCNRSIVVNSTLVDKSESARTTPKEATIGGVKFRRSKNGNLVQAEVAKMMR